MNEVGKEFVVKCMEAIEKRGIEHDCFDHGTLFVSLSNVISFII